MEHIIQMPVDPTYRVISVDNNHAYKELFIITGITEKEYHNIKRGETISVERGNCVFVISSDNVLCYGEIDFNVNSEDCETLDNFKWLNNLESKGVCIPSRYNYIKHECVSNMKSYLWTETFKISTLCRYFHGCLGKPQFTLIFREVK